MMKTVTALAVALTTLAVLTGCGGDSTDAVCVDRHTGKRVPDSRCDHTTDTVLWLYLPSGSVVPGIGHPYPHTGGSFRRPAGVTVNRVPARGVAPRRVAPAAPRRVVVRPPVRRVGR